MFEKSKEKRQEVTAEYSGIEHSEKMIYYWQM